MMLPVAYETGLSSIAIKEMVYQATAYCGFGKTLPFLKKLNNFLGAANVHLPLEPQGTTTPETRARAGEDKNAWIHAIRPRRYATHQQVACLQLLRRLLHARWLEHA